MALSAAVAWEVRTTGSDNNGGGFVTGAAGGTDWSQQNGAQVVFDGVTIAAHTAGVTATIIITGYTVLSTDVGNLVQITGGTLFLTGVYLISSVSTGANTWTLDRNATSGAGVGMVGNMGGAFATIGKALGVMVSSNIIFVKATATYTITASLTLPNSASLNSPSNAQPPNQIIGYTTTRTDNGRATIQFSTNANITGFDGSASNGWYISNFVIDGNSLVGRGVRFDKASVLRNCLVKNTVTNQAVEFDSFGSALINCEITGNTTGASLSAMECDGANATIWGCYIHDNTGSAITLSSGGLVAFNIIANNSGASSNGIFVNNSGLFQIFNNTIYNNGQDGIQMNNNQSLGSNSFVRNNLLISNGRYGLNGYASSLGWGKFAQWDGNAYFGNATAARNNADDTGTTNAINAANPYTNTLDVTLSGSPFTNAGAHDFTLNSTAGAGAAATGTATPGAIPGLSQTGSNSFGALQPSAAGTTNTYVIAPNITRYLTEEN